MAPEMVARQGYGRSADYWSLGCIAYEMLSGRPPFESKQGAKVLFSKIMTEKVKMPSGSSAAACKLLKGLLNRDVQARLGAARSTMFEVGGVAGLQKAEFFTDINWDKLACKQIAPPAVFSVNNDGDVQHFHEEFTQMALPRSVLDMSSEDFHPHRVDSKTFRGFSFIQDDFLLPERGDVEDQSYWESIQEDGESVSDCASSKMGEIEAAQQACQSSAKRPPRKRKKKPADIPGSITSTPAGTAANTPFASASNTPVASNTNTPEPSEAGYLPEKLDALEINESALPKMIIDITTNKMSSSTTSTQINVQNNTTSQAEPSVPTVSTSVPRQLKPVRETWQVTKKLDNPARPKQRNNINQNTYQKITLGQGAAAGATPQTSRANMQTISSSSANQKATPACQWSTARATPHANRAATQQTSVSLYGVGPKQISQGTTNRLSMQQQNGWDTGTGASQPVRANPHSCTRTDPAGTALPLAPSSDWRNHQMSPRDVDGRPVVQNIVPTVWPSLGGPPLNPNAPTPSKKPPTNLKGAWAAKVGKS